MRLDASADAGFGGIAGIRGAGSGAGRNPSWARVAAGFDTRLAPLRVHGVWDFDLGSMDGERRRLFADSRSSAAFDFCLARSLARVGGMLLTFAWSR